MTNSHQQILEQAYKLFNERNIESLLLLLSRNVVWPNGWEGGFVHGHEQVRDYWKRQWNEICPLVTPKHFVEKPDGTIEVIVHQEVTDKQGNVLLTNTVTHIYSFVGDKIKSMEIVSEK